MAGVGRTLLPFSVDRARTAPSGTLVVIAAATNGQRTTDSKVLVNEKYLE